MKIQTAEKLATKLKRRERNVFLALARHTNKNNVCFPFTKTIAAESGYCPRSVRYAVATLIAEGMVAKIERLNTDGSNSSNLFTLIPDPDFCTHGGNLCREGVQSLQPMEDVPAHTVIGSDAAISIGKSYKEPSIITYESTPAASADGTELTPAQMAPGTPEADFAANMPDSAAADIPLDLYDTESSYTTAAALTAQRYLQYTENLKHNRAGTPANKSGRKTLLTEKEKNRTAERREDAEFPLQRLLLQCGVDRFERELGAEKAAELRGTVTDLYFAAELKLFNVSVPRSVFFPALRYLDYQMLANAYARVSDRPADSIRNRAAYLSAAIYNSVKNLGGSKQPRKHKFSAPNPAVPDAAELLRLEQLLARQSAKI